MKKIIVISSIIIIMAGCAATGDNQINSDIEQRCKRLTDTIEQHAINTVQHTTAKEYFAKECQY
ncbi:MAG: hypothetical protein HRU25_06110 [Psychrobium sp.]|nr:hypothetical protein [Psychrobium sp.]